MSAPALIVLPYGDAEPRAARTVRDLLACTRQMRSDLRVEAAFPDHAAQDLSTVVDRLARRGHREVVVIPVLLGPAYQTAVDLPTAVRRSAERYHNVRVHLGQPVGADGGLLGVLDERLREALRQARIRELDALVLAGHGFSDPLANASVARLARLWGSRHRLPTSVAYSSSAPPSTGEAVRAWRRQGRRYVAVGSLFIAPGTLPDRSAELALEAGAVAVSAPLGGCEQVSRILLSRYSVAALELLEVPV